MKTKTMFANFSSLFSFLMHWHRWEYTNFGGRTCQLCGRFQHWKAHANMAGDYVDGPMPPNTKKDPVGQGLRLNRETLRVEDFDPT